MAAILDLKDYLIKSKTIPIIEPVKNNKHFKEKIKKVTDNNIPIILIVNPLVGEFKNSEIDIKYIKLLNNENSYIAYQISKNTSLSDIQIFINDFKGINKCFIHLADNLDLQSFFKMISKNKTIKYNFIDENINYDYKRALLSKLKMCVALTNASSTYSNDSIQMNNKDSHDYVDIVFRYKKYNYIGFSDYNVLGRDYLEGQYQDKSIQILYTVYENNTIKIKRYSTNEKLYENNKKLLFLKTVDKYYSDNYNMNFKTKGSKILYGCYHSSYYPGALKLKQASIEHHIELISNLDNKKLIK